MPWASNERDEVVKALAVACEVTGTSLTDAGKLFMLAELEQHPAREVVTAIKQAARECKQRLRLADVVGCMNKIDRKALSDARATRDLYESTLRCLALTERIDFRQSEKGNLERVRRELEARGYKIVPPYEEQKQIRSLPHWTEHDE